MQRPKKIIPLLIPILFVIGLPLGDALHDQFTDPFKTWVDSFEVVWLYPSVLVGIALLFGIPAAMAYRKEDEQVKDNKPSIEDRLFQKARAGQREAFTDRSNKKLAGRDFIDLEVSYTVEGSHDLAPLLNKGVEEGEKEQDLLKVFEGADGRLLMIGLPGSGKTTLLLQLAIALLDKYEWQIPVVLDIATWQPRFKTIEEWAVELLPDMGFNKRLAQQLVEEKKLLPLFDGLDELGEESRPGFLAAVEKYAAESANKFVITSRKAEYAATIDAAVEYQVVVNPFTLFQIREALHKKPSPERAAMLDRIDKDEYFAEAIKTPFYLNAVQLLFSNKNLSQQLVFEADSLEGRQREIETAFVEFALGGLENYSKEDGRRWLAFLADRMSRRGLVRFELVDMQYDWYRFGRRDIWSANFLDGLIFGLVIGLIGGIALSLLFGLLEGLLFFLFGALTNGLFGLEKGRVHSIVVKDKANWSFRGYLFYLKRNMSKSLVGSLVVGLALGTVLGLIEGLIGGMIYVTLVFSLACSLVISLAVSLFEVLFHDFSRYLKINSPYQRFYGSMWSLYFSILQHWHLCFILRKKSLVPRRYPDFLSAATKQNILESDGGSWRFRHRILQEYFVGVWEEEHGSEEALQDNWQPEE